jgi:methionine sulfoxide reductase heme-binding subunit
MPGRAGFPRVSFIFWAVAGDLGPDPVKEIERHAGLWGLQFLVATLAISPARHFGLNLIKMRRALGLLSFFYILLHFLTWIVLDMGLDWPQILGALSKRPYILIGFAAFVAMIPLALTSNNLAIRRIGPKAWSRLHKLTYVIAIGGVVHYLLLAKVITLQPLIYAALVLMLLAIRLVAVARRRPMST